MDPDQVAATGVQHDDLGETTTSAGAGCDGGSDDSWARALQRRGWDLSRKAAIAGVAATAAPVVVPPLFVLSVAGVALSLPFAAYLASLAATDRLMAALLPPPRTQSYHTCDPEDDEFLDAPEALSCEAHVFGHWSEAEDQDIMEENVSLASLPLSRDPRLSEPPVPASTDEEDTMAQGEFPFQEFGHESLVLGNREQKDEGTATEDNDYITMEALPRCFDVFGSEVPVLRDEDNMVQRVVEAPVPAEESVPELSVSDNGDKTEDGKRTDMKEMESNNEMPSPQPGIHITKLSDFPVPVFGNEDIVVQREGEDENSVRKSGQDSHVPDIGDKTEECKTKEEMLLQEVNVSESSVPDDITLQREIERDVTVEMVVEEVTINTSPVTGEVADEQKDSIATALPESKSLQASDLVAQELQGMVEAADVDDILETTLTEDIVLDICDTNTVGVEHHGEGGVSSVVSVVTVDDVVDLVSSRSTPVLGISDDMKSVEHRPDVDRSNQTTGYTLTNKEFRDKEVAEDKRVKTEDNKTMDDKVPTRSMAPQNIDVSKSPVPDDQSNIEDEVTVEMVLEEVTSSTDNLVTGEVVAVQLNIIASESESLPLSDHVAQELQAVNQAAVFDEIRGSTVMDPEDIIKDISDTNTASEVTVDDSKDLISSRSTPHVSARDGAPSVEGRPDVDHPHQATGVEYMVVNEGFRRNVVAEDMDNYTEEQLREQLDTLRTITGYCATPPSLTLEAELARLYIFVGVEPPVSLRDASDLNELNAKLRLLKSIIGVE